MVVGGQRGDGGWMQGDGRERGSRPKKRYKVGLEFLNTVRGPRAYFCTKLQQKLNNKVFSVFAYFNKYEPTRMPETSLFRIRMGPHLLSIILMA